MAGLGPSGMIALNARLMWCQGSDMYEINIQNNPDLKVLLKWHPDFLNMSRVSPHFPVTLSPTLRARHAIPQEARYFAFAYPFIGIDCLTPEQCSEFENKSRDSASICLALHGGFIYADASGNIIGATAMVDHGHGHGNGRARLTVAPEKVPKPYYVPLYKDGRFSQVVNPRLRDKGARLFCYVGPWEYLGPEMDIPNGAFLYLLEDDTCLCAHFLPWDRPEDNDAGKDLGEDTRTRTPTPTPMSTSTTSGENQLQQAQAPKAAANTGSHTSDSNNTNNTDNNSNGNHRSVGESAAPFSFLSWLKQLSTSSPGEKS